MPHQQLLSSLGVEVGKLVGGLGNQSVVVRACQMQARFLPENFAAHLKFSQLEHICWLHGLIF